MCVGGVRGWFRHLNGVFCSCAAGFGPDALVECGARVEREVHVEHEARVEREA